MWSAPFCSCSTTRYRPCARPAVAWQCLHLPDETFTAPLFLRIFLPSLLSTNWTRGWPACWACTRRHGPASCKLFGSTSRTTSCRTVMRRSTSTVTVTSDRYSKSLEAAFKHQIHTVFFSPSSSSSSKGIGTVSVHNWFSCISLGFKFETLSASLDLWLSSHEVCWDSHEAGGAAAAPWPHHYQSHD